MGSANFGAIVKLLKKPAGHDGDDGGVDLMRENRMYLRGTAHCEYQSMDDRRR